MRKSQGSLPLAFVLAMAADAGVAAPVNSSGDAQPIRAGLLTALAAPPAVFTTTADGKTYQTITTRKRIAQFFPNFKNCFSGTWRNC